MTNLNNIFEGFFGETLKKADEAIARAQREKEREITKVNVEKEKEYLDEVYNNFFGDIMKKVDSIKR